MSKECALPAAGHAAAESPAEAATAYLSQSERLWTTPGSRLQDLSCIVSHALRSHAFFFETIGAPVSTAIQADPRSWPQQCKETRGAVPGSRRRGDSGQVSSYLQSVDAVRLDDRGWSRRDPDPGPQLVSSFDVEKAGGTGAGVESEAAERMHARQASSCPVFASFTQETCTAPRRTWLSC